MLQTAFFTDFQKFMQRNIAYAKYKVGSTYYRADLVSINLVGSNKVVVDFVVDHTLATNITVTEVQLISTAGTVWLSKPDSTTRKAVQEGIHYRFTFTVTES